MGVEQIVQGLHGADGFSVYAGQDIPGYNARLRCRTAGLDLGDIQPCRDPVEPLVEGGEILALDPQPGTAGHIALADELVDDLHHRGAGNGKAQALYPGFVGKGADLHGVDPHHLAVAVDQGPAGVAGIQGGIGLDQVHGPAVDGHVPVDGGYDSVGHGAPKLHPQGVSDGHHRIPYPQGIGVTKLCRGQAFGPDIEHRQIRNRVCAHYGGVQLPLVRQPDSEALSVLDHVIIGHQIAFPRKDHTGAGSRGSQGAGGDGDHAGNVLLIDFLEAQALLLALRFFRSLMDGHCGLLLPQGGRGDRCLDGPAVCRGVGNGGSLLLVELLEHFDVQHAEGGGYPSQEDHRYQQQGDDGPMALRRLGAAGAINAVVEAAVKGEPIVFHL